MVKSAAISTTPQASCRKRPALQVRQDGKNGAVGGGYLYRYNVNQIGASFSSLSAAAETAVEEKSVEKKQEEEKEEKEKEQEAVKSPLKVAHTIVTHPPAPGWKYPRIPGGLAAKFAVFKLGSTQHKVRYTVCRYVFWYVWVLLKRVTFRYGQSGQYIGRGILGINEELQHCVALHRASRIRCLGL